MSNENIYETDSLTDDVSEIYGESETPPVKQKEKQGKSKFNIFIFLFSLLIAASIWLHVKSNENEDYEKTLNLVPVQLVGATDLEYNKNMSVISGYDNTVTVTLKGKRTDVEKYSAGDIYAYVDVSKISDSERQMLPVNVDPISGVSITLVSPSDIAVYADVIDVREVDVVVKAQYTIDGAYEIDDKDITKSVETVRVSGPVSVLETIDCAVAETNVGKLTGSVKSTTSIYLVDEKGGRINNPYLKMDKDMVEVNIPVYLKKYIQLTYEYDEELFSDYNITFELDFDKVLLIGDVLTMSNIDEICVFTLKRSHFEEDADGNYKPIEKSVEIKLPDGVRFYEEDDPTRVYIKINITPKKTEEPPVTEDPEITEAPDSPSQTPEE